MKRNVMMIALGCMLVTGAAQAAQSATTGNRLVDGFLGGLVARLGSHVYYENMPSATKNQAVILGGIVGLMAGVMSENNGVLSRNYCGYLTAGLITYIASFKFFPPAEKIEIVNDKLTAGSRAKSTRA